MSQVWAVKFGDRVVELRDLPIGTLAAIAKQTDHSLLECIGGPFSGDGTHLDPIVRACADWVGPEAVVPDPLTFQVAVEMFTLVDDDLPEGEEVPIDPPTSPAT